MTRMDPQLYNRRKESVMFYLKGVRPKDWTLELSQKYKVAPDSIWRDWNRRNEWLPIICHIDHATLQYAIFEEAKRIKDKAEDLYHNSTSTDAVKLGALKLMFRIVERLADLGRNARISKRIQVQEENTEKLLELIEGKGF